MPGVARLKLVLLAVLLTLPGGLVVALITLAYMALYRKLRARKRSVLDHLGRTNVDAHLHRIALDRADGREAAFASAPEMQRQP